MVTRTKISPDARTRDSAAVLASSVPLRHPDGSRVRAGSVSGALAVCAALGAELLAYALPGLQALLEAGLTPRQVASVVVHIVKRDAIGLAGTAHELGLLDDAGP